VVSNAPRVSVSERDAPNRADSAWDRPEWVAFDDRARITLLW
jgi:hypothetical protein